MMKDKPLASIIVNNYNYGRFLQDATDSALNQTYSNIEVIVVDDGSTDNSREIIDSYGKQVIPILKQNGGQASAFNTGFVVSRGEVIIFLDADDMLLPTAVEKAVEKLWQPEVVKVHWYQWEIDSQSKQTGQKYPDNYALGEGNFREKFIWSSFWWLDYYCQFHQYLLSYYKCLLQNDRCLVFDLR
jgi:glycosyltransferase involved in cell wall biosynthesis